MGYHVDEYGIDGPHWGRHQCGQNSVNLSKNKA